MSKNITKGQKIGQRTVITPNIEKRNGYNYYSLVECACGQYDIVNNNAFLKARAKSCKKCANKDRRIYFKINTTIGDWTIITPNKMNKGGRWFSRVKCRCGTESIIRNAYLNSGKTHSCEACRAKKVGQLNTTQNPWRSETNFLSLAAKRRNLEFNLCSNDVKKLSTQNCSACGRQPYMESRCKLVRLKGILRNSIDRIDPSKGYTIRNCQALCWDCNRWKGKLTQKEFEKLIRRLILFKT